MTETVSAADAPDVDVAVIGAGISGVGAARHLQKRCPERTFTILEARERIGGTWDLFRYPGIRSDSDMYTFGYAFRPWTDGSVFADGPAIRRYVRETAEETGIDRHIRFGRRVVRASWDTARAMWTLDIETSDGARERLAARYVMLCSGYYRYDRGHLPDFPGMADFSGEIIHPQLWPEDHDYAGKRVVIIGSGATAITLAPAMAKRAAGVVMLQRSPSFIAARPSRDGVADGLRKMLPAKAAYAITRAKQILLGMFFFNLSRRFPGYVRRQVLKAIQAELGEDFDVERHFSPAYDPWDQRFCLAPDGDFFAALKSGDASIVTDRIERFTKTGIRLESGETLEADLIIPATGLEMQIGGGIDLRVDGVRWNAPQAVTYRGMMASGLPNMTLAFGYTNASWTLKIDLTCERTCRLLNHMKRKGSDYCAPEPPADIARKPLLDVSSGYIRRALADLPSQGATPPWRTHQNYIADLVDIRYGRLEDGHLRFGVAGDRAMRPDGSALPAAAE